MGRGKHGWGRSLPLVGGMLTLLLNVGCSGSGAASGESAAHTFTANLGTATAYDFTLKTRQLLDRYQFRVVRYEATTDAIFFETEWKFRYPFEDEIQQGVEEARTRLTVTATPRVRATISSDLNSVRLEAENQVRYRNAVDWHYTEMSEMLKAYLREFSDKLATEFRAGIRRY